MALISIVICAVLSLTAAIHVFWAFGSTWPLRDEQALVDAVVGTKGMTQMPSMWLTLAVAVGIWAAGVFALWGGGVVELPLPIWMRKTSLSVLTAVFIVRGVFTYLPFGPIATTVQPFRTLDKKYYAPLILAIGAGYLVLLIQISAAFE